MDALGLRKQQETAPSEQAWVMLEIAAQLADIREELKWCRQHFVIWNERIVDYFESLVPDEIETKRGVK